MQVRDTNAGFPLVVTVSRPVGGVLSGSLAAPGVTIHLCGLPGDCPEGAGGPPSPAWPCSGWGLPSRPGHPGRWCALTAPFHPYLCPAPGRPIGGLFSVALSCGSPRLAVSPAPCPAESRPSSTRSTPGRGHPADSPSHPVCQRNSYTTPADRRAPRGESAGPKRGEGGRHSGYPDRVELAGPAARRSTAARSDPGASIHGKWPTFGSN